MTSRTTAAIFRRWPPIAFGNNCKSISNPNSSSSSRHAQRHRLRHFGARVAVGTGRFYSNEEILKHSPDRFLPDLSDPDVVIRTLDEL